MREKEQQLRGKRLLESQVTPAEPFKLKQFSEAKSRLHDPKEYRRRLDHDCAPPAPKPHSQDAAEEEIDLASFEAEVERLKREHGTKKAPTIAKDADGCPSYLRRMKDERATRQREEEEACALP